METNLLKTIKIARPTYRKIAIKTTPPPLSFWVIIGFLGLVCSIPKEVFAQDLRDYLIQAAENNPGLQASYSQYEARLERVNQASLPDPELQAGIFLKPMERLMGNQSADLRVMQMFPWFGMISTQKAEMNQMAQVDYQVFLEQKNQLFFQVKTTWYELIRLREEISIWEENLSYLEKYKRLALVKFQVGQSNSSSSAQMAKKTTARPSTSPSAMETMAEEKAPEGMSQAQSETMASSPMSTTEGMNQILQIEIEIKELENQIAQLNADLEPLQIKFNQLLNRDKEAEITLPEELEKAELRLDKKQVLDSIYKNNPMISMYDAELSALDQQTKMAKLEGKPMLGAGVNYMLFSPRPENGMQMGGQNMIMPMVSMSLPIYRKKINSKIKEAQLLKESTVYRQQETKNLLAMEWSNAFRDWENANRQLELYDSQIKLVEQQIQLLLTAFSANSTELDLVLRTQQRLLDYQLKRVNSINTQYQSLSKLEMLAANSLQIQSK
ncbi:TolC family protein [Algoriphagus sp.]|uniref:TolC family protein n=1 Tax=Algoriphagus sp. TaxID=1872435 RepID=UPI00260C65A9|nr:TolC family protein [Algoriphagus sp.]